MTSKQEIANALKECIERELEDGYKFFEDEYRFEVKADTQTALGELTIIAVALDGGFVTYTPAGPAVEPQYRQAVLEFISRANLSLLSGNFEMDMDTGVVDYKMYTPCHEIPSPEAIRQGFQAPVGVISHYGAGLDAVIRHGIEPQAAAAYLK